LEAKLSLKETCNILVVDDERSMREFLEIMLSQEGYSVTLSENGEKACMILDKEPFDMVITDIRMKGIDGIGVLKKAKSVNSDMIVILISAFATADTAVEAMKEGAYDFVPKPFDLSGFQELVKHALQSQNKTSSDIESKSGKYHFERLIGESPQMKKVYDLIKRVAQTKTNILLSGESGTGKELVARAIHESSPRSDRPFVVISCIGIPESLIESELFGYKKGAFTGAGADKEGLFDVADGGTVFLDEVGELPPSIQVKLLRVIQERTFTAVGGVDEKSVDVRFISATNKDLEDEVINDNFREDLYFRLNVIHVVLPPLRERIGDIPLLAEHFLKEYSLELDKNIRKISTYALDVLKQYRFPGNVRELENIIERSVALETSNIVLPESLTLSNFREKEIRKHRRKLDIGPDGISIEKVIADVERDYILNAMELAQGSKQRAAELLGINTRSLRYRMEKLGMKVLMAK
jgi:two-component system response regulator PilR (NtrC family)